jgi:fatty-acyl-CoA synthase
MVGAFKARVAPFNVNYRYVDDELVYLLKDADARALVYHARFAPNVARIRGEAAQARRAHPGRRRVRQRAAARRRRLRERAGEAPRERPALAWSPDDLYILYTGGTTGMPKGVLWRQEDIFFGALGGTRDGGRSSAASRRSSRRRAGRSCAPARPAVHARRRALDGVHDDAPGRHVVMQAAPERLDPTTSGRPIAREKVRFLDIVGDAFGRPLHRSAGRSSSTTCPPFGICSPAGRSSRRR